MPRVRFQKGKQKEFLDSVLSSSGCPSLRELIHRGIDVSYSSLKNYYSERRLFPLQLFELLCDLGNQNKEKLSFKIVDDFWGQSKGGRKSRK